MCKTQSLSEKLFSSNSGSIGAGCLSSSVMTSILSTSSLKVTFDFFLSWGDSSSGVEGPSSMAISWSLIFEKSGDVARSEVLSVGDKLKLFIQHCFKLILPRVAPSICIPIMSASLLVSSEMLCGRPSLSK